MGAQLARPVVTTCRLLSRSELRLLSKIELKDVMSLAGKPSPTPVITFDALNTLYTFKEPIGQQYLKLAQRCGFRGFSKPQAIEEAFGVSYKDLVKQYPNYGKGSFADPREWWSLLIHKAFNRAVSGSRIPADLPDQLYQHFSSGAAYQLYGDIKPMFQRLRKARNIDLHSLQYDSLRWLVLPVVGVITNSDPRAIQVLRDLGLRVGTGESQQVFDGSPGSGWFGTSRVVSPNWNPSNDIDFVCTSWDAGSEKPDRAIFDHALLLANAVVESTLKQYLDGPDKIVGTLGEFEARDQFREARRALYWTHIGDDMNKDYAGAYSWGSARAIFLKRDSPLTSKEARILRRPLEKGGYLSSLEDFWTTRPKT